MKAPLADRFESHRIQNKPWGELDKLSRPLYAPLRTFPACSGNCSQGRRPCVTPEACVLPETDATPDYSGERLGLLIMLVSGIVSVAAMLHLAGWLGWLS